MYDTCAGHLVIIRIKFDPLINNFTHLTFLIRDDLF